MVGQKQYDDDESLVARVQKGDRRAFAVLVERYSQMFYAAAYRICGRVDDAEDIVQEAFLKFWSKPEAYDPQKSAKFTTWFYRVVTNLAIDYKRRKRPEAGSDVIDLAADERMGADEVIEMDEQQAALEVAIQALPERQKLALNLCFYEGLSNKEAADVLGVGVKALESLLMRAKAGLKDALDAKGFLSENVESERMKVGS
ncbi:MAG: sigma-70 family RNA polymerase sigma factor [Alphaproteobacteria bacterium]|nr:sigma-70 family RNA polymerase sigma factor [Alphaproteobacteria bacterium]